MELQQQIAFGPFRFDRATQCLWQGNQEIRLRARTRAVLHYLVEHPGRIISRQEFEQHVWVGMHVTQSVLRVSIRELRQALGDAEAMPQYIETVGQQGYRFCATTWRSGAAASLEVPFVGRQAELDTLQTALGHAQRGVLQLVFVAGDPGISKTTLVRRLLNDGFTAKLQAIPALARPPWCASFCLRCPRQPVGHENPNQLKCLTLVPVMITLEQPIFL